MNWLRLSAGMVLALPAFFGLRSEFRAWQSRDWPTVEGKVLESKVETHQRSHTISDGGKAKEPLHRLRLRYQYTPPGTRYRIGTRVSFGDNGSTERHEVEVLAARYPVGAPVTVHYSPDDPKLAVLETRGGPVNHLFIGLGATMSGAWFFVTRKRRKPREA